MEDMPSATAWVTPPDGGDPVPTAARGGAVQTVAVNPMVLVLVQTARAGQTVVRRNDTVMPAAVPETEALLHVGPVPAPVTRS